MQTGVTGLKIAKFNILYMCISLLLIDLFSWKMVLQNMQKLLFEKLKTQFLGQFLGGSWTPACFWAPPPKMS